MTTRLLLALATMALAGCSPSGPPPVAVNHITLYAAHPLWGGTNVFLNGDGALWVQDHPRGKGQVERRFQGTLPPADLKELDALLSRHDFPSIRIPPRMGMPDEAVVVLVILLKDGRKVELSAFERDVHEGFTPVYHWLRVRGERIDRTQPIYDGVLDPSWKPPSF